MEAKQENFDVLVSGKKVAEAPDVNPVNIETDIECKECLLNIKAELPLTESEIELINGCVDVVSANDDDDVIFGPKEIIELGDLAKKYPSHTNKILACSHHLIESVDCEGEIPQGIFATIAAAHGALADMLTFGLSAGDAEAYSDDDDDDDFEEDDFDEGDFGENTKADEENTKADEENTKADEENTKISE